MVYLKIFKSNLTHYDFTYQPGLNVLKTEFNDNPKDSCVPGGFYFTTPEYIHNFFNYGTMIGEINLPLDDPEFKMVKDPDGNKWRANKIIIDKLYKLFDPTIFEKYYDQFNIIVIFKWAIDSNYRDIINLIVKKIGFECYDEIIKILNYIQHMDDASKIQILYESYGIKKLLVLLEFIGTTMGELITIAAQNENINLCRDLINENKTLLGKVIRIAALHGTNNFCRDLINEYKNEVRENKYVFEEIIKKAAEDGDIDLVCCIITEKDNGINISMGHDYAMRYAAKNGHTIIVKLLLENGADVCAEDNFAIRWASRNGHLDVVKLLIEHGADIHINDDEPLWRSARKGYHEIVKLLLENGANVHAKNNAAFVENRNKQMLELLNKYK